MKSLTKRIGVLATVFAMIVLNILGSCFIFGNKAFAETVSDEAYEYFYNQIKIDPIAERFYKAYENLDKNGELKKGKLQYDLIANGVATKEEVQAYVNGGDGNRLAKSFGKGRDAYYMDHPDLFYIDIFSTSITAGMQGGEYVAYLDSSRALTLYKSESMSSEAAVNEAIHNYNAAVASVVEGANSVSGIKEKIEYVNDYISAHNKYGYGTVVEGDKNVDTPKADFIFTSYGALVNGESVCEGYAKSFKAVMDRLGIPCVCVAGYASATGSGNLQPHMWNYVQVDGMWYAVDVTYNSASAHKPWILKGGQSMFDSHMEDGSVSSSGFELRYPALKPYDYGVDSDENGMSIVGTYNETEGEGKTLDITVSYEGMGALKLQEKGMYLAYSFGIRDGGKETQWSNWVNIVAVNAALGVELYPVTDTETKVVNLATSVEYIRFALLKRAPDSKGDYITGDKIVSYDPGKITAEDFWFEATTPYRNEGFGSYFPSPGAAGVYPANTGSLPVDKTYEIRIVYNTTLELDAGYTNENLEMDFYTSRGNDTIKEKAVLENLKWDGDKTITFTFTPSRMYIHNLADYYFTPVGLVGRDSKKIPDPVIYSFKGKSVVCSKIFNDGRLYMNVFGEPNILDNSDVSVTDFKDENGNYYAASQRSQLMLVASKPTTRQEEKMDEVLKKETGVKDEEIMASATYEISLQICGVVTKVPNGSYMQVAFGFPEGYSPDDAGATFKIYHYKHDNAGNITGVEEIPVIVTEYGLIARVESFSPFTVVQIKNSSPAVSESKTSNIYAYVNGEVGGSIKADGKSGILQVNDSITYDITPDEGYSVACVRLNGKVIDAKYYSGNKLTLKKSDIKSDNMLEVTFMAKEFADDYTSKGISISYGESFDFAQPEGSGAVTGIIIGCFAGAAAVVAIALAVWFVLKKKKEQAADDEVAMAEAGAPVAKKPKSSAAKTAVTKSGKTDASAKKSTVKKPSSSNSGKKTNKK
ncbi:MAG: hypothetical protein HFE40_01730 [Clostridia bacterium]|nr:hypothetical protein [Clostridia bacterium]